MTVRAAQATPHVRYMIYRTLYQMYHGYHIDREWFTITRLVKEIDHFTRDEIELLMLRFMKIKLIEGKPTDYPCEFRLKVESLAKVLQRGNLNVS